MEIFNTDLTHVIDWFSANRLTLNLDKINFILFKSRRKNNPKDIGLKINSVPVTQVESTRFLVGRAYM